MGVLWPGRAVARACCGQACPRGAKRRRPSRPVLSVARTRQVRSGRALCARAHGDGAREACAHTAHVTRKSNEIKDLMPQDLPIQRTTSVSTQSASMCMRSALRQSFLPQVDSLLRTADVAKYLSATHLEDRFKCGASLRTSTSRRSRLFERNRGSDVPLGRVVRPREAGMLSCPHKQAPTALPKHVRRARIYPISGPLQSPGHAAVNEHGMRPGSRLHR